MHRQLVLSFVIAVSWTSACQKEGAVETVPPEVLEPSLKKATPTVDPDQAAIAASISSAAKTPKFPTEVRPPLASDLNQYIKDLGTEGALLALIETNRGVVRCELFEKKTPMTVANFVGLARGLKPFRDTTGAQVARPFYDGLLFHRVIPTFMIQGGDPAGDGTGGPGYQFANEIHPLLRHDGPGTLAMANSGADTNGSQFYITEDARAQLDGTYSVFGRCKNVGVVRDIARTERDSSDRPTPPQTIKNIVVIRGDL